MNISNNLSCKYLNPQLHLKSCLPTLPSIGPEKKFLGSFDQLSESWSTRLKKVQGASSILITAVKAAQLSSQCPLWRNHKRVLSWQVLPCLPFLLGHSIKTEPPQPSFPLLIVIKALESNLILLIGKPLEMAILTCFTLPSAQKCPPCKLVDAKVQLEFWTTRGLEKLPILALQTPPEVNDEMSWYEIRQYV